MLDFLKHINTNYSALLSLLSSVIMVIVTIIYVVQTKRQADYAKESAELVAKQIKTDKQPCIVPSVVDSKGIAFDAGDYTRIQLGFDISLENVGESPAINVYTLCAIELQQSKNSEGKEINLSAALLPNFVQAIAVRAKEEINIHFETDEVLDLVNELSIAMEKNWERIRTNPSKHHYVGANLNIKVLFKNIMGQWSESVISYEIAWLEYLEPPKSSSHNINANTIPPLVIKEDDEFRAVLISQSYAPFAHKMVTDEYVKKIISQYKDESPWLINSIHEDNI